MENNLNIAYITVKRKLIQVAYSSVIEPYETHCMRD